MKTREVRDALFRSILRRTSLYETIYMLLETVAKRSNLKRYRCTKRFFLTSVFQEQAFLNVMYPWNNFLVE